MRIAFVDTETSSIDVRDARLLEVACVVYQVTDSGWRLYQAASHIIISPEDGCSSSVIHGIHPGVFTKDHMSGYMVDTIKCMMGASDIVCGHNIRAFDLPIMEREMGAVPGVLFDTLHDMRWPGATSRRLGHLCADYGVSALNSHEALADCMMLASLCQKRGKDFFDAIDAVKWRKQKPQVKI